MKKGKEAIEVYRKKEKEYKALSKEKKEEYQKRKVTEIQNLNCEVNVWKYIKQLRSKKLYDLYLYSNRIVEEVFLRITAWL